jgi:ribosomal protein S17
MSETTTQQRGRRKVMQGVVVSDKMDKTIVVLVEDRVKHPLYGKVMAKSSRIKVHDEGNTAGIGDRVRVTEPPSVVVATSWRFALVAEKSGLGTGILDEPRMTGFPL